MITDPSNAFRIDNDVKVVVASPDATPSFVKAHTKPKGPAAAQYLLEELPTLARVLPKRS